MKIKNWKDFQHFKDRRPPWIKLHRDILERRDINMISDRSFRVLVCLWLLASEDKDMEGNLPPVGDIAFRLRLKESEIIKAIQELTHFIEQGDIKPISERYQADVPETETETYKQEAETETNLLSYSEEPASPISLLDHFESLWNLYPHKQGKKEAFRHFNASVKTEENKSSIAIALNNYLQHLKVNTWKRPMNGSTWFNNWGDWVAWVEPETPVEAAVVKEDSTLAMLRRNYGGQNGSMGEGNNDGAVVEVTFKDVTIPSIG